MIYCSIKSIIHAIGRKSLQKDFKQLSLYTSDHEIIDLEIKDLELMTVHHDIRLMMTNDTKNSLREPLKPNAGNSFLSLCMGRVICAPSTAGGM